MNDNLPNGYVRCSYIESIGTQYIDTGFKPNNNTRVVIDVELPTQSTYPKPIFGSRNGSTTSSGSFIVWAFSNSSFRSDFGSNTIMASLSSTGRFLIDKNKNNITINGSQFINETSTFQSDYNLCIFGQMDVDGIDTRMISARLYSCQIYDNGTLVRDYIPCTNSNGVYGLYDTVTNSFIGSGSSIELTGGTEYVNENETYHPLPEGYTQCYYIHSKGKAWIDTGFKPTSNTKVVFFGQNESSSSGWTFGCWESASKNQFAFSCNKSYAFRYGTTNHVDTYNASLGLMRVYLDKNKYFKNGDLYTLTEQTFSCPYTMYLFAINAAGSVSSGKFTGKLIYCDIYDNDVLVRRYTPAKNPEGVYGLYDKVNDTFVASSGEEQFTGYEYGSMHQVDYIESDNISWIDTRFTPTANTRVVMEVSDISESSGDIMGAEDFRTSIDGISSIADLYFGTSDIIYITIPSTYYQRIIFDKGPNSITYYGTTVERTPVSVEETSMYLYLLASNVRATNTGGSYCKLYSCKIYEGDTLVRDFVPCRASEAYKGFYGLYDRVEGLFYNTGSSNSFTGKLFDYTELATDNSLRRRLMNANCGGGGDWDSSNYLTMVALEDGFQAQIDSVCEYTLNGRTWVELSSGTYTPSINTGEKICFRRTLTTTASHANGIFKTTSKYALEGNCLSFIYGDDAANRTDEMMPYAFAYLFYKDTNLISVSSGFLPSNVTASHCYCFMFYGCSNLQNAPGLPALVVADSAYTEMFRECGSLTEQPFLPAMELGEYCYQGMFQDSGVEYVMPLYAETVESHSYSYMYYGSAVKRFDKSILNARIIGYYGCESMFGRCQFESFEMFGLNLIESVDAYGFHQMFTMCTIPGGSISVVLPKSHNRYAFARMFSGVSFTRSMDLIFATNGKILLDRACEGMFSNCTNLISALFKDTIYSRDYSCSNMFYDCVNLDYISGLEMVIYGSGSGQGMFCNCYNLYTTNGGSISIVSENAALTCYGMFRNCRRLSETPTIESVPPIEGIVGRFDDMFYGCTILSLVYIGADYSANHMNNWLYGVSSSGQIFTNGHDWSSAPRDYDGIPEGWTLVN